MKQRDVVSVSPVDESDEMGEFVDDAEAETIGVESKSITIEDEMEVMRKIRDPKLPSQEAIDDHWVGGHTVYRDGDDDDDDVFMICM